MKKATKKKQGQGGLEDTEEEDTEEDDSQKKAKKDNEEEYGQEGESQGRRPTLNASAVRKSKTAERVLLSCG